MSAILESEKINGCPALPLAVQGWFEILKNGYGSDTIVLSWDQSVIWIEIDGVPAAVIVWQYQDYRREIWISQSYVKPEFRGRGLFRELYRRIVEIASEKKAIRIAGGIRPNNAPMIAAAEACGRKLDYCVYSQPVVPAEVTA